MILSFLYRDVQVFFYFKTLKVAAIFFLVTGIYYGGIYELKRIDYNDVCNLKEISVTIFVSQRLVC